jgi:carboxymethylenebutenolidase
MLKEDFDTLVPAGPGLDRRGFVRGALGTGFAAAAGPVMAQTAIRTPSDGLVVGEVTVPVGSFRMPAYRAAPANKPNAPVVLVLSEIFGVHEYIADTARRFARAGYFAIAPELFVRQGDPTEFGELARLIAEVVSKVPDEQVMADLDATVAWARNEGADAAKLAVTGFCWGGRQTWLYAAHNPAVKAGVAWYGRLVGPSSPLQPRHPVDVAARLHAPVLGLYGEADTGIPLDTVEQMQTALAGGNAAARASRFVIYPEAPHAFHADYRPSFRQGPAEDGWRRCLDWFKTHGVA